MKEDKLYWIWLSMMPSISYKKTLLIYNNLGGPDNLWKARKESLEKQGYFSEKEIQQISDSQLRRTAIEMMELLMRNNIKFVTLVEEDYPELLRCIPNPPCTLYIRGNLMKEDKAIAVVGARSATGYGEAAAYTLSKEMARKKLTVVSGMARGIDSFAHKGSIDGGGRTIAVLGSGIDVVYPPENYRLYEKIIACGAVVSEYPPGTQALPFQFPARNRIISGLSVGTLVVEANIKSGSLITAAFALEQGREVMAVPGNINSPKSIGCNKLIREGAAAITSIKDIIDELELKDFVKSRGRKNIKKNSETTELCLEEKLILEALKHGERYFDELMKITGISNVIVNSFLLMLEMKGMVEQRPGRLYKSIEL